MPNAATPTKCTLHPAGWGEVSHCLLAVKEHLFIYPGAAWMGILGSMPNIFAGAGLASKGKGSKVGMRLGSWTSHFLPWLPGTTLFLPCSISHLPAQKLPIPLLLALFFPCPFPAYHCTCLNTGHPLQQSRGCCHHLQWCPWNDCWHHSLRQHKGMYIVIHAFTLPQKLVRIGPHGYSPMHIYQSVCSVEHSGTYFRINKCRHVQNIPFIVVWDILSPFLGFTLFRINTVPVLHYWNPL